MAERLLSIIETTIHKEDNWVKDVMRWAVVCIGRGNPNLYNRALQVGEIIQDFHVDYGDTSCTQINIVGMLKGSRKAAV